MGKLVKKNSIISKFVVFLALILICSSLVSAKPIDWFLKLQKIKVFQSSKQDVEEVFDQLKAIYSSDKDGKESGWGEIIEYQTNDGKLRVFYSTGKCSEITNHNGWDVEKDVIVNFEFKPNKPIKLSKLDLDLETFVAYKESDNPTYNYRSSELGINFSTLGGKVTSIRYSLTPEMKELDCEKVLKK